MLLCPAAPVHSVHITVHSEPNVAIHCIRTLLSVGDEMDALSGLDMRFGLTAVSRLGPCTHDLWV